MSEFIGKRIKGVAYGEHDRDDGRVIITFDDDTNLVITAGNQGTANWLDFSRKGEIKNEKEIVIQDN